MFVRDYPVFLLSIELLLSLSFLSNTLLLLSLGVALPIFKRVKRIVSLLAIDRLAFDRLRKLGKNLRGYVFPGSTDCLIHNFDPVPHGT
jgi:hypothetical protein